MRPAVVLIFALSGVPALLLAQSDGASGDVVATVRSESGTPLAEAEVRIDSHQTLTDPHGVARLTVPAGRRRLTVAASGSGPPPSRYRFRSVIVYERGGRYFIDEDRWKRKHRHHDRHDDRYRDDD